MSISIVCTVILLVHCIDSDDCFFLQFVLWYYLFIVFILISIYYYSLYCDITCSLYIFWWFLVTTVCIVILLVPCIDSDDCLLLQFVLWCYLSLYWFWWLLLQFVLWYCTTPWARNFVRKNSAIQMLLLPLLSSPPPSLSSSTRPTIREKTATTRTSTTIKLWRPSL